MAAKKATEADWEQVRNRTPEIAVGGLMHVTMPDGGWIHATIYEITPEGKVVLNGLEGELFEQSDMVWVGLNHTEP